MGQRGPYGVGGGGLPMGQGEMGGRGGPAPFDDVMFFLGGVGGGIKGAPPALTVAETEQVGVRNWEHWEGILGGTGRAHRETGRGTGETGRDWEGM